MNSCEMISVFILEKGTRYVCNFYTIFVMEERLTVKEECAYLTSKLIPISERFSMGILSKIFCWLSWLYFICHFESDIFSLEELHSRKERAEKISVGDYYFCIYKYYFVVYECIYRWKWYLGKEIVDSIEILERDMYEWYHHFTSF